MTFVFTDDQIICNDALVVRVGGGSVCHEAGVAVFVGGHFAYLMCHDLAVVGFVRRLERDDVAFLECARVGLFDDYQVACIEVCRFHGVGQYDECAVAEHAAVRAVECRDGNDRECHHSH